VFGVLLLRIPLPPNTSLLGIFSFLLQEYLYLPYIISSLIILIVWNQFVHGILFLAWPFTVFQSSLIFLMSLVEILTVTSVNFLPAWLFGVGWIAIVGAFIRFNNIRYLPKDKQIWIAPLNNYPIFSKKTEVSDGLLYMGMGIIVLIISVIFNYIIDLVSRYNNSFPSIIKLGILVLLFIMAIGILLIDKKNRRIYLDIFVKGSDLAVTPHGIISYLKGVEKDT